MTHFLDIAIPVFGAALAAFAVLRWGFRGFVAGIALYWGSGILRIDLLNALDSQRNAGVLDAAWVAFLGWAIGFAWCLAFLIGRLIFRYVRTRKIDHGEPA